MSALASSAGLLGLILLLSAPVTWLTSSEEPGFAIAKVVIGLLCAGLWGLRFWQRRAGRVSSRGSVHIVVSAQWLGALLVGGGVLVASLDSSGFAWDLTSEQVYTVAEETRALIDKMSAPMRIEGYFAAGQQQRKVLKKLVEQMRAAGADVELELIDPNRDPKRARAALVGPESPRILVKMGDREERLRLPTEQKLAQAMARLNGSQRTVFVLVGHGEPKLDGEDGDGFARIARELQGEGLQLAYLDLAKEGRVPAGAAALLWIEPRTPLLAQELRSLSLYLDVGGRLLVAAGAGADEAVNPAIADTGLQLGSGLVVDPQVSGAPEVGGAAAAMVAAYTDHPVVARLAAAGLRTLLTTPAPIEMVRPKRGQLMPLAAASAEAWVEADVESRVWRRPADAAQAPVLAALWSADTSAVEARRADEARVALVGDSAHISNGGLAHAGNRALALNIVNWLSSSDDDFAISARERRVSRLFLTRKERSRLRLLVLDGLPLMILFPGLLVWQRRRG